MPRPLSRARRVDRDERSAARIATTVAEVHTMTKRLFLTPYLFLAPALLVIAVFVLYPIGAVVYYSFTDYNIITPPVWVGLKNYQQLVQDPVFWLALQHSFTYLLVTPILIFLSIVPGHRGQPPAAGHQPVSRPVLHPGHQRQHCRGHCLAAAAGDQWAAQQHADLGGRAAERRCSGWPSRAYTLPIAMLLTIWLGLGYYMMIFLAGLQNISEELYDAAVIDGCNAWQKHWYVSFPGLRPQITFVAVISSLAALEVFNEIFVLTGGLGGILNSGVTMVFYLWRQAFRLQHAGYASAMAMVLLADHAGLFGLQYPLPRARDGGRLMRPGQRPAPAPPRPPAAALRTGTLEAVFWYGVLGPDRARHHSALRLGAADLAQRAATTPSIPCRRNLFRTT